MALRNVAHDLPRKGIAEWGARFAAHSSNWPRLVQSRYERTASWHPRRPIGVQKNVYAILIVILDSDNPQVSVSNKLPWSEHGTDVRVLDVSR